MGSKNLVIPRLIPIINSSIPLFVENCAPHSRYFSDELGTLIFLIKTRTNIYFLRCIWYYRNMEKDTFIIKENTLSYGRGYVYSLQYHLVWCTKYRKQVLVNGLDEECKKMLQELAEE